MKLKLPSTKAVAIVLRDLNDNVEGACEVRLRVWFGGAWVVRHGDKFQEVNRDGYCGTSHIPGVVNGKSVKFNSIGVASDLLSQIKEGRTL